HLHLDARLAHAAQRLEPVRDLAPHRLELAPGRVAEHYFERHPVAVDADAAHRPARHVVLVRVGVDELAEGLGDLLFGDRHSVSCLHLAGAAGAAPARAALQACDSTEHSGAAAAGTGPAWR